MDRSKIFVSLTPELLSTLPLSLANEISAACADDVISLGLLDSLVSASEQNLADAEEAIIKWHQRINILKTFRTDVESIAI